MCQTPCGDRIVIKARSDSCSCGPVTHSQQRKYCPKGEQAGSQVVKEPIHFMYKTDMYIVHAIYTTVHIYVHIYTHICTHTVYIYTSCRRPYVHNIYNNIPIVAVTNYLKRLNKVYLLSLSSGVRSLKWVSLGWNQGLARWHSFCKLWGRISFLAFSSF